MNLLMPTLNKNMTAFLAARRGRGASAVLLVGALCLLMGCAYNRPYFREMVTTSNGVVTVRELAVPTWAIWPATTSLDKQRASLGKTFSLGTTGLEQESGGTNIVEALKAIDSILGRIK